MSTTSLTRGSLARGGRLLKQALAVIVAVLLATALYALVIDALPPAMIGLDTTSVTLAAFGAMVGHLVVVWVAGMLALRWTQ
jgi:hypothetical protein